MCVEVELSIAFVFTGLLFIEQNLSSDRANVAFVTQCELLSMQA